MIRACWAAVVLVAATVVLGTPAMVLNMLVPRSYATLRFGRLWSWIMLRTIGARVTYEGLEHARRPHPCIFMANHQSWVDIWVTVRVVPAPSLYVAKRSIMHIPVLGWCLHAAGFIGIDRGNRARAIRSLQRAAERIRQGRPVVFFPEGTRSRSGRLQPFKKGPFYLALQAGAPVVPVAISGSGRVWPPGSWRPRPGPVRVRFAPPIDVARYLPDDVDGLMAAVFGAIAERLEPWEAPPASAAASESP